MPASCLAPEFTRHRQYEALRAYFMEQLSGAAAHRFGYSPKAFRVLCRQFRHDPDKRAGFFQLSKPGPRHAPGRDRARDWAVAMRKRNLSIYDMQRELDAAGHGISINALAVLMSPKEATRQGEREEGFTRLPRAFRTPKVLDERIELKGYRGQLRQIPITELGHEDPTVLLTNQLGPSCPTLVTRYAHRMLIENGISEAVQFFHLDALSSMVGLKVDFDLQITLMARSLYRLLADPIGREYERAQAKKIFRNLLDVSATVTIDQRRVVVTLDKHAHNPFLVSSGLARQPTPMPWFGNKERILKFA